MRSRTEIEQEIECATYAVDSDGKRYKETWKNIPINTELLLDIRDLLTSHGSGGSGGVIGTGQN